MKNAVVRQSNFELLRIISMLMIVGLHYFNGDMGGALSQLTQTDYNYYVTYFFESMFIVGVNTFVLITGYFQINKKCVQINKVIELLFIMTFYGLFFYSIALILGWQSFSIVGTIKAAFPILIGLKWFIKVFIILYLLIPFLNAGLNQLTKKIYQTFLVIMLFFFSFYPSFLPNSPVTDNGYGIITFVLMYAIGGYLKKFYEPNGTKSIYFSGYILCATITFAFSLFVVLVLGRDNSQVWGYNFIFNVFGSVLLFLFFSKLNIKSKKINYVASFVLGVYFIHTDPALNDFVYGGLLQTQNYWFSQWFIVHVLLSILFVYAASTIIDIARKWLFDRVGKVVIPFFKKHIPVLWGEVPISQRQVP
ncbi:acyltransferase [Acetobacterium bakii]|uniref:Acyltransferase 3 domain-containing protein n=1 Tax=Acetobacterium bakii TaxID=52689 RepID=A0A0L6U0L5_9FIRM|nr:acyltransferase family protein [Acetobacterium bakii]KNZ42059.1 hypothetical protein AKG39_08490 [Acetobacterium bakii]